MRNNRQILGVTILLALAAAAGLAQQAEMSARDVFRKAKNRFYVAQAESAPAQKPAAKSQKPAPPPAYHEPRPAQEPTQVAEAAPPSTPKPPTHKPVKPAVERTPSRAAEQEPKFVQAAAVEPEPLSLRYSIQRRKADGSVEEVDPDAAFKSGESIRLTVESSDQASLYIVTQGSSGKWSVLFPSKQIAGGANRVDPFQTYVIPPGGWFSFDEKTGSERLFVMLSRKPVEDLEKLIYNLRDENSDRPLGGPVMMAENIRPIDDSTIMGMRKVYTRDLVFEKVTDAPTATPTGATPGDEPKMETAMYIATKTTGDAARVVADVTLSHQ